MRRANEISGLDLNLPWPHLARQRQIRLPTLFNCCARPLFGARS